MARLLYVFLNKAIIWELEMSRFYELAKSNHIIVDLLILSKLFSVCFLLLLRHLVVRNNRPICKFFLGINMGIVADTVSSKKNSVEIL